MSEKAQFCEICPYCAYQNRARIRMRAKARANDISKRGDGRGGAPYKTSLSKDKKGSDMGAAWIGVIMIAVFIGVLAALNILEKGSLD